LIEIKKERKKETGLWSLKKDSKKQNTILRASHRQTEYRQGEPNRFTPK